MCTSQHTSPLLVNMLKRNYKLITDLCDSSRWSHICVINYSALMIVFSQVLCAMLEFELLDSSDLKMQIITTLQSTSQGKAMYNELCERQIALRELVSVVNSHLLYMSL